MGDSLPGPPDFSRPFSQSLPEVTNMSTTIDWAACERLVGSLASKFHQQGFDLEDLKQEARLAILESRADYTTQTGVSLNTFLGRRIRDALRKFIADGSDLFEISRDWVAESISNGPDAAIRAKSKDECNALRNAMGAEKYRKPRRVVETVRATVSLDEERDGEGDVLSLHEQIGTGPEQEAALTLKETTKRLDAATIEALRSGGGGLWSEVIDLRTQGYSFAEIGSKIGRSEGAAKKLWGRAQKRLAAKRAA